MSPEPDRYEDERWPTLEGLPAVRPANGAEAQNIGHATESKARRVRELLAASLCSARIACFCAARHGTTDILRFGGRDEVGAQNLYIVLSPSVLSKKRSCIFFPSTAPATSANAPLWYSSCTAEQTVFGPIHCPTFFPTSSPAWMMIFFGELNSNNIHSSMRECARRKRSHCVCGNDAAIMA